MVEFHDSWRASQGKNMHNPCCDLFKQGDLIYPSAGGWAIDTDSGVMCTSIIRDVMDVFLVELKLEGFIEEAQTRWFPVIHDNRCPVGGEGDPDANCEGTWSGAQDEERQEDDPLMLEDFQGVFLVLSIFLFLAVVWSFLEKRFPGASPHYAHN